MIYIKSIKEFLFFSGIVVYGMFSYPFPQFIGLGEIFFSLILIYCVGGRGVANLFGGGFVIHRQNNAAFYQTVSIIFLILITMPLVKSIVNGWVLGDILRDVVPLIYIFIPLCLLHLNNVKNTKLTEMLIWGLAIAGVLFSIRYFIEIRQSPLSVGKTLYLDNLKYYPYEPSVLFSAIFLTLKSIDVLKKISLVNCFKSFVFMVGGLIALSSMAGMLLRAPIFLYLLSCLIFYCVTVWKIKSIYVKAFLISIVVLMLILLSENSSMVFDKLLEKTYVTGVNNKDIELVGVIDVITGSPSTFLAGIGWGGLFLNPVFDDNVRFTHSIVSFFLLKAGVIGLVLILIYLIYVFWISIRGLSYKNLAIFLAGWSSLLIGVNFQVTYKCFSFGAIMLLLVCIGNNSPANTFFRQLFFRIKPLRGERHHS